MAWTRDTFRFDARALTTVLAWMRLVGVGGQLLTVLLVPRLWHVPLPQAPLFGAIALAALAAGAALLRLHRPWPVREAEAAAHAGFDITLLAWSLYFTGGASNPFITLLLVPIALTAAALSWPLVVAVTALATAFYFALMRWYVPLPGVHLMHDAGFALHLTGMAVNFVIAACLLAAFVGGLANALRRQNAAIRKERERALRDQGIIAIATQAAGAAHELNTPLSSMRMLVGELMRERAADVPLQQDLALLAGEVERCRSALQDMVAARREQLGAHPRRVPLQDFVHECVQRFGLLRPEVELEVSLDPGQAQVRMEFAPDMTHALLNLLHNAADASLQAGCDRIALAARIGDGALQLTVDDHGSGLPEQALRVGFPHRSEKIDGMGIGLLLARATAERLRGELRASATAAGSAVQLRIPLGSLEHAA